MYVTKPFLALLAAASTAQAFDKINVDHLAPANEKRTVSNIVRGVSDAVGNLFQSRASCPPVWTTVRDTLTAQFLADGQCTDAARAAIRGAFHDCFNGACDGSLILANECANTENAGLARLCTNLDTVAKDNKVGYADLIQYAAAHAIKTCPGGPTVPVKVGRKDSSTANPTGVLPQPNQSAGDLMKLFASKGFSAIDLVALIGAHTAGRQRTTDPSRAGQTFDTTPGQWDNKFYQETQNGKAPFILQSDKALADNIVSGVPFKAFALSQAAWAAAFVPAMSKMSMMGVSGGGLVDCTSALPGGSSKRDVKRSGMFERLGW